MLQSDIEKVVIMMLGNKIKQLRLSHKLTLDELASKLNELYPDTVNFNKGKLSKWENNKEEPKLSSVRLLADFYNVTIDSLYKSNSFDTPYKDINYIYNKLDPYNKTKLYNYAEKQLEQQEQESLNSKVIPMVGKAAANPNVLEYGDVDIEQQSFSHVPEGADCAIYIQGDSMEPLIKDGSIVFYKRQEDVESGEIAVVEINGDGATCKRVIKDYGNKQIILRSVNDRYEDRVLHDEKVRIIGKVILQ